MLKVVLRFSRIWSEDSQGGLRFVGRMRWECGALWKGGVGLNQSKCSARTHWGRAGAVGVMQKQWQGWFHDSFRFLQLCGLPPTSSNKEKRPERKSLKGRLGRKSLVDAVNSRGGSRWAWRSQTHAGDVLLALMLLRQLGFPLHCTHYPRSLSQTPEHSTWVLFVCFLF